MEKENEPPKNDIEKLDDNNNNLKQEVKNEKLNEKMDIDEINTENNKENNKEDNKEDNKIKENENIKNDKDNNNNNIEIKDEKNHKKEKNSLMRFPLAKIKNIMKLDTDIKLCQKDAYIVIGKLTEIFLKDLAQGAFSICKSCKRKTINLEDINSAIKMNPKMGFINFNSIFYVEELNKSKKRPNSTKKIENKIEKEMGEYNSSMNNDKYEVEVKERKKRGKSTKNKNKNPANNMTLDSMFGPKN